jgi:L-ascorbate metabolism protein UlaG (beta-lactamase superfamily)
MASETLKAFDSPLQTQSSLRRDGKFRNRHPMHKNGLRKMLQIMWRFAFDKPAGTVPARPIPVQAISTEQLLAAPDRSLFRLGHSTMLLKLRGVFWLTDPVFSERASPLQWIGPKRFHQPPISIAELPPIEGVILSHDHYDHLDHAAILQLAGKVKHFLAPLGVGDTLIKWGVPAEKVQQLDWWQSTRVSGLQLVATPARHFSGRGLTDGNHTLWASWVILDDDLRLFFSGDTGYFDGFKEIGKRYGPFDLTMIETGAYGPDWPDVHMQPEQTLQAHLDLDGKHLLPVHNGTFDLALHLWQDPFERIVLLAEAKGVAVSTPQMGEMLNVAAPQAGRRWWRQQVAGG